MLRRVREDGLQLRDASDVLRADREVVLAAVRQNGLALQFARHKLRTTDRDVVLAAVRQNGLALQFVDAGLNFDRDGVALEAVQRTGGALQYVSGYLRYDKAFIFAVVRENVYAFKYAPPEWKTDKEVCLEAVGLYAQVSEDRRWSTKEIWRRARILRRFIAGSVCSQQLRARTGGESLLERSRFLERRAARRWVFRTGGGAPLTHGGGSG